MHMNEIETTRLKIRPFTLEDCDAFYHIMRDEKVNTYLPWFVLTSLSQAKEMLENKYINGSGIHYAICVKENNIPIGYVSISDDEAHDFGYGLRQDFWHKGIASEACLGVIQHIKDKLPFVTATHDIDNIHSGQVMRKLGFQYQYTYEEQWMPKNIMVTFRMYQLNFKHPQAVYQEYWNMYENHYIEEDM